MIFKKKKKLGSIDTLIDKDNIIKDRTGINSLVKTAKKNYIRHKK